VNKSSSKKKGAKAFPVLPTIRVGGYEETEGCNWKKTSGDGNGKQSFWGREEIDRNRKEK